VIHRRVYEDWLAHAAHTQATPSQPLLANWLEITEQEFCRVIFHNWSESFASLRCTPTGFTVLKNMYQVWQVSLDTQGVIKPMCGAVSLALHRQLRVPYYVHGKHMWVFGSQPALELEMAGHDLETWAQMFG
jgi:hypothetical protein